MDVQLDVYPHVSGVLLVTLLDVTIGIAPKKVGI